MALTLCNNCGSIEGGWHEPDIVEDPNHPPITKLGRFGLRATNDEQDLVCNQCGEAGGYEGIPEHDDYDMER